MAHTYHLWYINPKIFLENGCTEALITLFILAQTWFFKWFVPSMQGLEGPMALIGDNLGSHFSHSILKDCNTNNIHFIIATKFHLSLPSTGCGCI